MEHRIANQQSTPWQRFGTKSEQKLLKRDHSQEMKGDHHSQRTKENPNKMISTESAPNRMLLKVKGKSFTLFTIIGNVIYFLQEIAYKSS